MKDIRQTPQYAIFMQNIGWKVERKQGVNYFIKKFPLIGSFIKIQRPGKTDFNQVDMLTKKYRALRIIVEPKTNQQINQLTNHGLCQGKSFFLPSKTIHIDLSKSEKKLLKEMHHKTRYNIKKAIRNKLKVRRSKDIKTFADFWQDCAKRQRGMFLSQKKEITELYKAFGKNAHLVLVYNDKALVSGILIIMTEDIAYYMYAASSEFGKKLFAPTLNAWEAIKLAKNLGCKIFDFEGIYDERFPLKSWQGFTRFKKSFGGYEVEYPGTFTKTRIPL